MVSYQMTKPIAGAKMHSELVSDMELFYYVLGDKNKPTLIFLHGILAFTEIYKSFLKSLSDLSGFKKEFLISFFSSAFAFWFNKMMGNVTLPSKKSFPISFPNNFSSEL